MTLFFLFLLPLLAFFTGGILHERYRIRRGRTPGLFQHFLANGSDTFRGRMLLWHLSAVLITIALVLSGADGWIQAALQDARPFDRPFLRFMLLVGNFWHLIPALLFWAWAIWKKRKRLRLAAFAALQALFLNAAVNTLLKMVSGRRGPANPTATYRRRAPFPKSMDPGDFDFAFWTHTFRDGRFFWPSGHTASIFAFVTALSVFYPEKKWIPMTGYPLALFTALTMVAGDFHWFSDVVAGAIGGIVIGAVCGRYFRTRFLDNRQSP